MKKILLLTAVALATASYAAPSFNLSPASIQSGKTTVVNLNYKNDSNAGVTAGIKFTLSLPAGVTLDSASSAGAPFTCTASGNDITADGIDFANVGQPLSDTTGVCAFSITVPSTVASGEITASITSEEHGDKDANPIAGANSTLSPVQITAAAAGFTVTATAGANGALACTPTSGAAGTAVACTATPNANFEVDTWSGACASTTAGATTCNFTLNKDETVGVSFKAAGSGGGSTYTVAASPIGNGSVTCTPLSGNVPAQISCTATPGTGATQTSWGGSCASATIGQACTFDAVAGNNVVTAAFNGGNTPVGQPVPAIGLLGLFGMLASLMGAAAMVLRRKA